jgi:uncharacterized protein
VIEIDDRLIQGIVERITRVTRPDRVILFGSVASGEVTGDSDIDLLVLEPDVRDPREAGRRLREALEGLGIAVDLIVMPTRRFEETKGVIGGIAYPANKYGRVIYEAA